MGSQHGRTIRKYVGRLLTVTLAWGCSNAGSDLVIPPVHTRTVRVHVYIDRDASGAQSSLDTTLARAQVSLHPARGGQSLLSSTTNEAGDALLYPAPVGEYSVQVDSASVGDTLLVVAVDPVFLPASPDTNAVVVNVRVSYAVMSLSQARAAPPGRRVLVRGIILAGVQSFRDTTAHMQDPSGYIRLTRVSLRNGTGNNPGDTVVVIGTTAVRSGQPTLDQAVITTLGSRLAPVPFSLSTAVAAGASGGTLDAALVQITGAIIIDTATVSPDFRVTGNDGSGPITLILDAQGNFNRSSFVPGRTMSARGVLVPSAGQWQLKPRGSGDVTVF